MTDYRKPDSSMVTASAPQVGANVLGGSRRTALLALGIQLVVLGVLFFGTYAAMVGTWIRSETFAHGFVIVPIVLYLVWRRRSILRTLPVRPDPWALLFIAGAGCLWLIGYMGEAQVAAQYGATLLIPLTVWLTMGRRIAREVLFPLVFLMLAVPFGEFLVPPLMQFTADFTAALLHLTGIPVYREGMQLALPTSVWSVEAACSGLRYLIASFTLGCLFAYLTYRSPWRRFGFIVLSVIVPILANGLRAFTIVLIGHFISMKLATGIDHIIYGWLFFGLITFLLFWIGGYWREDDASDHSAAESGRPQGLSTSPRRIVAVAVGGSLLAAFWPAYSRIAERIAPTEPFTVDAPALSSWRLADARLGYLPTYPGAPAHVNAEYDQRSARAGLYLGLYRNQHEHAELIAWENALVPHREHPVKGDWHVQSTGRRTVQGPSGPLSVDTAVLSRGDDQIVVWRWYWVDRRFTGSRMEAKVRTIYDHLLGRDDAAAAVVVYSPFDIEPAEADRTLDRFVKTLMPRLQRSLEAADG